MSELSIVNILKKGIIQVKIQPMLWKNVKVTGGLLAERQKTIAEKNA